MTIYKKYSKAYEVLKNGVYDYEGENPVKHIYERFTAEYSWAIERYGFYKALTDWLAGLALNIPYMNHDIMDTFGINEKQLQTYFPFMAMRLRELFIAEKLMK